MPRKKVDKINETYQIVSIPIKTKLRKIRIDFTLEDGLVKFKDENPSLIEQQKFEKFYNEQEENL